MSDDVFISMLIEESTFLQSVALGDLTFLAQYNRTENFLWGQRKRDLMLKWHYLIHLGLVATTHQSYLPLMSRTDSVGYFNLVMMMVKVYIY